MLGSLANFKCAQPSSLYLRLRKSAIQFSSAAWFLLVLCLLPGNMYIQLRSRLEIKHANKLVLSASIGKMCLKQLAALCDA